MLRPTTETPRQDLPPAYKQTVENIGCGKCRGGWVCHYGGSFSASEFPSPKQSLFQSLRKLGFDLDSKRDNIGKAGFLERQGSLGDGMVKAGKPFDVVCNHRSDDLRILCRPYARVLALLQNSAGEGFTSGIHAFRRTA